MSQSESQTAPLEQYMPRRTAGKSSSRQLNPVEDVQEYVVKFAKQQPQTAALWCFGIGFLVGWKLKPW
ncbi:hypothetical protein [Thalassoglobus polymorphus]|uniref:Uncharacterized protein n=1 Tax=Thalassoglobus polymorphus TaxID=2527994 RepID=A0A517QUJ4_9PLAN|nr:hypothetical protein [Thalassoglobus polymorphus]QDT35310.1 hypothetical protein Mal48_45860 [Thalassoglobus polymorphus]